MTKNYSRPKNPYIPGGVVKGGEFFGREDILQRIQEYISESKQNAILLTGPRRIGKTSILFKIRDELPKDQFITVYFDLMGKSNSKLNEILHELAKKIAECAGVKSPRISKNFKLEKGFLQQVYSVIGEKKLLVLLDEFDTLDYVSEKGEDESDGIASNQFMKYVRNLLEQPGQIAFVIVLGRKLSDLSNTSLSLFKASQQIKVSVMPRGEATRLIQSVESTGAIRYEQRAIERLLELTNGHPYYVQILCNTLYRRVWDTNLEDGQVAVVASALVDEIIEDALESSNPAFEWIWDGIPPAEKIVLSALVSILPNEDSTATISEINSLLEGRRLRAYTGQFTIAPDNLVEWEILKRVEETKFQFFIEVFRRWIQKNKKLEIVSDEINKVNRRAETKYEAAKEAHAANELKSAITDYREAIRLNPAHLNARSSLAQALYEDNQINAAITEYEEVYQFSKSSAEEPLTQVLSYRAQQYETKKQLLQALADYERILLIKEADTNAKEKRISILAQLGDEALQKNDIDTAENYYESAGVLGKRAISIQAKRHELSVINLEKKHAKEIKQVTRTFINRMILIGISGIALTFCSILTFGMTTGVWDIPKVFASNTPTNTVTPTNTETSTSTPTITPTDTITFTPSDTPTPTITNTPWRRVNYIPFTASFIDSTQNGENVLIARDNGDIEVWKSIPNKKLYLIYNLYINESIFDIQYAANDSYIFVRTRNAILIYDSNLQDASDPFRRIETPSIASMVIQPGNKDHQVAYINAKGELSIIDWSDKKILFENKFSSVKEAAYSDDGKKMAILSASGGVTIWDIEKDEPIEVNIPAMPASYGTNISRGNLMWQGDRIGLAISYVGEGYYYYNYIVWQSTDLNKSIIITASCQVSCASKYQLTTDGTLLISTVDGYVAVYDTKTGSRLFNQSIFTDTSTCGYIKDIEYIAGLREIITANSGCNVTISLLDNPIWTPTITPTRSLTPTNTYTPTQTFTPTKTYTPTLPPPTLTATVKP